MLVYMKCAMDKKLGHKNATGHMYPAIEPFDQRMVEVGDGHRLYVEQCGNPDGAPVVVLHGGPGGGCSPAMRRYFDPAHYRVVLFDQRGCGRSRPHASVESNTTWHLIADIEQIRELLGIGRWDVFGGSWGAALALLYAQAHVQAVRNLVLRGVFLMTQAELGWFYGGGAGAFWPENWQRFAGMVPRGERGDLIAAYSKRLFSGDRTEETRFARAWAEWENGLASISSSGGGSGGPADYARAFARIENHYFRHGGFLETDAQILRNAGKLDKIQTFIVQGRYDMICPPASAIRLHQSLKRSKLRIVQDAGHALSEPGITAELVRITDALAKDVQRES